MGAVEGQERVAVLPMNLPIPPGVVAFARRRRILLAGVAGAALALGIGLAVLPEAGLRWGIVASLHRLGLPQGAVSETDVALFGRRVAIRSLSAGPGHRFGIDGLDLVFRWMPLIHRRVSLERLDLAGLGIDIRRRGDTLEIAGLPLALGGGDGAPSWGFDVTALTVGGSRLTYRDGPLAVELAIDSLTVDDLRSWEPATPARFRLDGRFNGAPVRLEGTATPFADKPGFAVAVTADGLDLAPLQPLLATAGIGEAAGTVTAALKVTGTPARVEASGTLSLTAPALALAGTRVAAEQATLTTGQASLDVAAAAVSWQGSLTAAHARLTTEAITATPERVAFTGTAAAAATAWRVDGRLESDNATVATGDVIVEHRRLDVTAAAESARPPYEGGPPLAVTVPEATIDGLAVRDVAQTRDLLAADHLRLTDLRLAPDAGLALGHGEIRGMAALQGRGRGTAAFPWRAEARSVRLDGVRFAPAHGVSADGLAFDGATFRLTRTKDGLAGFSSVGRDEGGEAPRVALRRLTIDGKSRLLFADEAQSRPARLEINGIKLSLTGLDSGNPEHDSQIEARAQAGTGSLTASGTLRPFADQQTAQLKARIRAFELPPLSPYAEDSLGVHLETGHFDGEVTVGLRQGTLDGRIDLKLANFAVGDPDPNAPLARKAEMPVGTVLNLLRDGDGQIALTIPMSGDVSDPQFDVSDAVNQAVAGALRSTALTTLKLVFPVAALVSMVIDDAQRIGLEPLPFAPGTEDLADSQRRQLAGVGELMRQRPSLNLTLCGVANDAADWPVLLDQRRQEQLGVLFKVQKLMGVQPKGKDAEPDPEALGALAERRSAAAKAFLIDEAGIDAGRLFSCRPKAETATAADARGPRVDLVL
ncbi:MAG: DUF748 domain-containing protein [Magnetospirillum sp.]|nr:DUF748 domain-containing protein [Magnetospirillum sp.]